MNSDCWVMGGLFNQLPGGGHTHGALTTLILSDEDLVCLGELDIWYWCCEAIQMHGYSLGFSWCPLCFHELKLESQWLLSDLLVSLSDD